MKRVKKTKGGVYAYLLSTGVLVKGSLEEIQKAKDQYWKEYKARWRKLKRKEEKEITVSFNTDELKEISSEAKRHKMSRTRFIKHASLAYINKSFIVPNNLEVRKIAQLLSMAHNLIQEALYETKINRLSGLNMLETILNLERQILPLLRNPQSLTDGIKQYASKSLDNKSQLIDLIKSL